MVQSPWWTMLNVIFIIMSNLWKFIIFGQQKSVKSKFFFDFTLLLRTANDEEILMSIHYFK